MISLKQILELQSLKIKMGDMNLMEPVMSLSVAYRGSQRPSQC